MKMAAHRWQILFFLCGVSQTFVVGKLLNPNDIRFTLRKLYMCENFEQLVKVDINYHDNMVDAEFELKEEFTDIYQTAVTVHKLEGDEWKSVTNTSGNTCELLEKYFKSAWKKLRKNIEPALTEDCTAESGRYKVTNFEVSKEDVSLNAVNTGLFRSKVIVSDEFDTEIACIMLDVELHEK